MESLKWDDIGGEWELWRGTLFCGFVMRGEKGFIVAPVDAPAFVATSLEEAKKSLERVARK